MALQWCLSGRESTHRLVLYPDPPPKRKKGGLKEGNEGGP